MLRQSAMSASSRLSLLSPRFVPATVLATQLLLRLPTAPTSQPFRSLRQPTPAAQRPYSAAAEQPDATKDEGAKAENEGAKAEEAKSAEEAEVGSVEATLKRSLEAKEAEVRQWKEQAMRSKAEFLNLQSRSARDQKSAREFAIQSFAKDLLDNIDNLDRALSTVPQAKLDVIKAAGPEQSEDAKDLVNLYEGLQLTESGLMQTLSRHGLVRCDPLNEKFNPNEHEATFLTPQPDKEDGTVFHVQQKGFKLNGRVVRAAKVGVVKNA